MIVTLTANPSLDRTVTLEAPLLVGEVQQARSVREDAGGKGVNVVRVVAAAGQDALGILPLAADDPYARLASGLPLRSVAIPGHARANLTVTDPAGETTKINLPGAPLGEAEAAALVDEVVVAADGAEWLALCGSLPPGVGADFYARIVAAVRTRTAKTPRIAVDTSGAALAAAVSAGGADLIKPNEHELVDLLLRLRAAAGEEVERAGEEMRAAVAADPVAAVVALAASVIPDRTAAALVTLGGAGAVLIDASGARQASPPPTEVRSTVGAGDSSLAGYLLADLAGADADERLRGAVRYGSATAALPGTQLASPADLTTTDIPVHRLA